ncbi:EMILIN-2-like [Chiloscyllium plagiosum]|uniref:EMILIN-2-like n=1 Tax=Chiloscyllium plagiosum TaxID=36176 RepID=UPI001CB803C3|nr:EMILIN-2-like [Chiloscyllium plagiosum]
MLENCPVTMTGRRVEREAVWLSFSVILISFLLSHVQATPPSSRYHLYSARSPPRQAANRLTGRNKNWCAYIVKKNVTCSVLDSAASYIKPEYQPCPWGQLNCPPTVRYRTHFRPLYKVAYKVVTQLEWRCCPGYKGEDCKNGWSQQTANFPLPSSAPRQRNLIPKSTDSQVHKLPSTDAQGQKIQQLEYEVQRLNQVLEKMQTSVTGLSDNLRHSVQEDTSKMVATLLSNLRLPSSAVGFETSHIPVVHENGDTLYQSAMGEVMSELTEVKDTLKAKGDMLDELHGMVTGHNGQLKKLMEAVQAPVSTYSPFSNGDFYQSYIDSKIETLKKELMIGIDEKFADLKNSCEYKLMSLKEQCEENESNYEHVEELLHDKEAGLREEISNLRNHLLQSPGYFNCCSHIATLRQQLNNMDRKVYRIADANRLLNARLDNELEHFTTLNLEDIFSERLEEIESRINVTEKNAEEHCFYIEYTLRELIENEVDGVKELVKERVQVLETKHNNDFALFSNITLTGARDSEQESIQRSDLNFSTDRINNVMDYVEVRLHNLEYLCRTDCASVTKEMKDIKVDLETCKHDNKQLLRKTEQNLIVLNALNDTVREGLKMMEENEDLEMIQGEIISLKVNVNAIGESVQAQWEGLTRNNETLLTVESTLTKKQEELLDMIYKLHETDKSLKSQLQKNNSSQLNEMKKQLDQLTRQVTHDIDKCKDHAQGIQKEVHYVDSRVAHIENVCSKLDNISTSLQRIKDGLNKHVSSLWNCAHQMNETVKSHSNEIDLLKSAVHRFSNQGPKIVQKTDVLLPVQPVPVERGQAGPPGPPKPRQTPVTGTSYGVIGEVGYAGPPGSMDISDVNGSHETKQQITPAPGRDHELSGHFVTFGPPGISENKAARKHVSFSVGLTRKPFIGNAGIIRFNKVLVNDGHHYNTNTGVFTAPFEGQYLVTAVLAPQRNEHIEAILSVSNQSIMQMDTSGYRIELLESQRPLMGRQTCGGVGIFNLILNLKAEDEVSVIVIDGKLVDTDEMYSTFSGTLLYETSSQS